MADHELRSDLFRHARRYTACIENQEEYVQEAWTRIAQCPDDFGNNYYSEEGRKAIQAAYMREYRRVYGEVPTNVNGIGEGTRKNIVPPGAVHLYDGKWLDIGPEKIDRWYYPGEWDEYGLSDDGFSVLSFYRIVIADT